MRTFATVKLAAVWCAASLLSTAALAADAKGPADEAAAGMGASCMAQATDKKLAGAARNSFMKRCETDAKAACDMHAGERKLSGAAKSSFTKKCVRDATGAAT